MPNFNDTVSRTFILLKPDALERGLVGEILKRFERKGFNIVTTEMRWADKKLAEEHYSEHKDHSKFFKSMVDSITCGPVIAVILEGANVVKASRQIIGFASPLHDSPIGTIRADFAIHEPQNLVHGSDSVHAAIREITLWYGKEWVKPKVEIKPEIPQIPKKASKNYKKAEHKDLFKFLSEPEPVPEPKSLLFLNVADNLNVASNVASKMG